MKKMQEFKAGDLIKKPREILDAAAKMPVKIVTGPSRYRGREPVVILSERRYLKLLGYPND